MKYPNYLSTALLTVAATAGVMAPAHALLTARSVPPASFLDYHVDTVPQLAFEVTYDKAVRARLARHFHLSGAAMGAYVRDNLVLSRLRAPLRTRVYCVSPAGREYFVLMTLKAGTPVFALRGTGQPILRLVCGNPLVSALPPAPKQKAAADKVAAKPAAKVAAKTLVKPAPITRVAPDLASLEATPAAWSVPAITTAGSGEVLFTQAASSASGAGWLAWLPVVGGLAGVFASQHGSGGGGTQTVAQTFSGAHTTLMPSPFPGSPAGFPGVFTPGGTPSAPMGGSPSSPSGGPAPVPEPGPACVFAVGGLTLGALRLRRK